MGISEMIFKKSLIPHFGEFPKRETNYLDIYTVQSGYLPQIVVPAYISAFTSSCLIQDQGGILFVALNTFCKNCFEEI